MFVREFRNFISNSKMKICFVLLYIFAFTTAFWRVDVAVTEAFLSTVVLGVYLVNRRNSNKQMRQYLETLSLNIESATHNSVMNSPFPMVILKKNGEIIWYNTSFGELISKDNFSSPYIQNAFEGFEIKDDEALYCNICIDGKTFDAYGVCTSNDINQNEKKDNSSENIYIYYFVDTTILTNIKQEKIDSRLVKGYMYIDNLDELTKNIPDSDRTAILSQIEKHMYDFVLKYNAILSKSERDRYSFVMEYRDFKAMKEEKFFILKTVKDVNATDIPLTLSIGVGAGDTLHETEDFAKIAIDLALGRGGDQAVIKEGNDIVYFGGNSREIERRTKVRSRIVALYFKEYVENNDKVIIEGHKNPDTDCLGAALGISRIVRAYGKEAYIVLDENNMNVEAMMKKLDNNREYEGLFVSSQTAETLFDEKTVTVVVDAHRLSLLPAPGIIEKSNKNVLIDHHRKGADYITNTILAFHEPYASSTSELVVEMLGYLDGKVKLRKAEAEMLYGGILLDTQNFSVKTGVRTFEAASFLRKAGMEPASAKDLIKNDFETYLKVSGIVKSCEICFENIAIAKYYGEEESSIFIAQAADTLIDIKGIEASFVIFKNRDRVLISARSNGKINVQLIMEKLGGGGHQLVAGAQLEDITVDKATMIIKNTLEEMFSQNDN